MPSAIEVKNLFFKYHSDFVLKDISFEVPAGEITTLMGRNASGKTTLLKCMCGIFRDYSGDIVLRRGNLKNIGRREIAKTLSLVTQNPGRTFSYSILDYVALGRAPHQNILNTPTGDDLDRAGYILETLGVKDYREKPYKETSSGEGHLINFARALAQDTEILLLDEPTSYLDFNNQIMIFSLIKKLCGEFKKTIMMTLHNPAEMLNISDNVAILKNGCIEEFGKKDDIVTGELLSYLFGVKVEIKKDGENYFVFPV